MLIINKYQINESKIKGNDKKYQMIKNKNEVNNKYQIRESKDKVNNK